MSESSFADLERLNESEGSPAAIEWLIDALQQRSEFDRLFDALLLKRKFEMGLPVARPTSFDDVPADKQLQFEEHYIDAARQVGELWLEKGDIPRAWLYFRTIREPDQVAQAIEEMEVPREPDERTEQILQIALYEGANPLKGLELMLRTHGTCNTITAVDQQMPHFSQEDRSRAARLLARHLYDELRSSIRREVEQKLALAPPADSIRELIAGRDWLFEGGNYHVDVSHLNAVVRFCRFLEPADEELKLAVELAEYGSRLSPQFQYPGDPPFDDFYPAHVEFFKVVQGDDPDGALDYFRKKLETETENEAKLLVAYVLVDLLMRTDRMDEAVDVAAEHLTEVDESSGFSIAQLFQQAGRMDRMREVARKKGDLVMYTAALVNGSHGAEAAVTKTPAESESQ